MSLSGVDGFVNSDEARLSHIDLALMGTQHELQGEHTHTLTQTHTQTQTHTHSIDPFTAARNVLVSWLC